VSANHLHTDRFDLVAGAIRATSNEPRLTAALRLAQELQRAAANTMQPDRDAALLEAMFRTGDGLSAIAALHAIAEIPVASADGLLIDVVMGGEPSLAAHAAWALQGRSPCPRAVTGLRRLMSDGGFAAMVAERTLLGWAADPASTPMRPNSREDGDGIVVVQPFLHARLDRLGSQLGSGDSGGIASLLRSLGAALPDVEAIDDVITVTRRFEGESRSETLAPSHRVERIRVGPDGPMPWRDGWVHRVQIEREFMAIGAALTGRHVVWHLRMADVGALVAADVAGRLGHRVVFTAAPDPHIVIDALQDSGRLNRSNFALEDAAVQYWFRARLVERLATEADHIVLLPRPTIERELIELVGVDPVDLAHRSTVIAEGVEVRAIDTATRHRAQHGRSDMAQQIIRSLPVERQALPWLLTVGRLHPSKGPQRIVEAVAGDPTLSQLVNIVIVGGDLDHPAADEQSTIERVRLAGADADRGLVTLTGHLRPTVVNDLLAETAAHGGVYVCASDKEEFGLAVVEALAAGATVVAPERGGPQTYVDHGATGVLCDTLSIGALRDAIVEALALTATPGRADRARTMVRDHLGIDQMAARLGEVYRALLPSVASPESTGRSTGGSAGRVYR